MDKVVSYEQIQGFIGAIRDLRQGFITNFFWNDQKHPYWLNTDSLFFEKADNCYILLHHDIGFDSLFYIATSISAVVEAISKISLDQDCVIDIVCKDSGEEEKEALSKIGFTSYKCLYRMSHIGLLTGSEEWESSQDVIVGCQEDAQVIYDALRKGFDPLCEQLPSIQEVIDFAQREQLLVVKEKNELCGFIISETAGKTSWYLRYWYTSPEYRNQGVGAKLIKTALVKAKDTRRQQLWVISDNENAIRRYEHYGFKREPINDYVMIKKKR